MPAPHYQQTPQPPPQQPNAARQQQQPQQQQQLQQPAARSPAAPLVSAVVSRKAIGDSARASHANAALQRVPAGPLTSLQLMAIQMQQDKEAKLLQQQADTPARQDNSNASAPAPEALASPRDSDTGAGIPEDKLCNICGVRKASKRAGTTDGVTIKLCLECLVRLTRVQRDHAHVVQATSTQMAPGASKKGAPVSNYGAAPVPQARTARVFLCLTPPPPSVLTHTHLSLPARI
jgi:hypothetical protein